MIKGIEALLTISQLDENDLRLARLGIEEAEHWREWAHKIPSLSFPPDWQVKIIPPFAGTMARFHVQQDDAFVSVYLDVFGRLGGMFRPYWEIYPNAEGDSQRYAIEDTDDLLAAIQSSLSARRKGDAT